jgi:adenylate cyclase
MVLSIIIVIVLGLTAVIAYMTAYTMEEESKRQLTQNLEQNVHLLEYFLEVGENNLEIWRNNPLIESIIRDSGMASVFIPSLRNDFRKTRDKELWIENILILQDDTVIYNDSEDFEFSDGSNGSPDGIKNLVSLPDNVASAVNLKIFNPNQFKDVLVIKRSYSDNQLFSGNSKIVLIIDLAIVNNKLFRNVQIGKQGFISIMVQSMSGEISILPPARSGEEIYHFVTASQRWLSYDDIPEEHGSIIIHKRQLNKYPLALIGIISFSDIREPVLNLLYLSVAFGAIAILVGIISAVFFATKLTGPIRGLTIKVRRIASGDGGIKKQIQESDGPIISKVNHLITSETSFGNINIDDHDEISVLSKAFDAMSSKLERDTKSLLDLTGVFEKFVPHQFLDRIKTGKIDDVALGKGENDFMTILFSDIRSFTTYSEGMDPQELFSFLNDYLNVMNRQIHKNHGFIDKFIGDAIMALFDHPDLDNNVEAESAVKAAINMQEELQAFNQQRSKEGFESIGTGIGIHSGQVMIGTIGSKERMDFTVLGDNVNLASRIESLTKQYGVGILISDSTLRLLRDLDQFQHRELDWVKVKGKSKPVELYEIFNNDPPEIQEMKRKAGSSIMRGLTQRRRKAWDKSIAAFEKALSIYPDDQAAKHHIQQCQLLRHMDLPDDWDGSLELDHK